MLFREHSRFDVVDALCDRFFQRRRSASGTANAKALMNTTASHGKFGHKILILKITHHHCIWSFRARATQQCEGKCLVLSWFWHQDDRPARNTTSPFRESFDLLDLLELFTLPNLPTVNIEAITFQARKEVSKGIGFQDAMLVEAWHIHDVDPDLQASMAASDRSATFVRCL